MKAFVADQSFDAHAFLKAAARFAISQGWREEDAASEMLLQALEVRERKPGQVLAMDVLFLRARDKMSPRGSDGLGGRTQRDAMNHTISDVTVTPDGDEIRTSECTVIDFSANYTAITARRVDGVARMATANLRRARYLARLPFGHLPFIL